MLDRRGFGYALALTLIVTFAAPPACMRSKTDTLLDGCGLHSYGTALWWTAMVAANAV